MSKEIKGSVNVLRYATTNGKYLGTQVQDELFDANGNLDIDAYTESEIDRMVGVFPLSHYGSFSFLPAGVNGSFEGASDVPGYRYRKLFLEDDGTLTILRPGTNGAKRALYYSYVDNAISTTSLNNAISTNKEYNPGYFGGNYTAKMPYASDDKIVAGLAFDANDNPFSFISWMNGTLNDTQHVGSIVPTSTILPNGGAVRFVMTGNTQVFFFVENHPDAPNTISFELRSVPLAQIQAGATTLTVTEYQNWTNHSFYNRTFTSPDILLLECKQSTTAADFPYLLRPASATSGNEVYMVQPDFYAAQNSAGLIRLRVVGDLYCSTTSSNIRSYHAFSVNINPTTKVVTLEDFTGTTPPYTVTDDGTGTLSYTSLTQSPDVGVTNNGNRANKGVSYYLMNNGTSFAILSENLGSSPTKLNRCVYPGITDVYELIRTKQHTAGNFLAGAMKTSYGSPVGAEVTSFEWLPNNRYKVGSFDSDTVYRNSINQYVPGPTYQFGSVSLGTINGFAPTTNRVFSNNGINDKIFINSISSTGVITTNGGVLIENVKTSTPLSYDENLNQTGSISINNTLLTTLKNQQLAATALPVDLNNQTNISVFIPQQTDMPAFALISGITTNLTNFMRVVEVNVNARSGVISTLTFKRLVTEMNNQMSGFSTNATYGVINQSVGITIYDAGTFYFIGGVDPYMYRTTGDTSSMTWYAKVTKSTQQMDDFKHFSSYQAHTSGAGGVPFAVPGVGFGYLDAATAANDDRVRIIFQGKGTTLAQYNAWADVGNKILLASQDVAQGFIIYFTEETPVLISGKSFTLPVQNINLTSIKANPANSTFNIYVRLQEGLAQYVASETPIAESYNTIWIGTVTTNANQISNINVQKRSRIDIYGASLEAAGSSFPVSYGTPNAAGTINW